MWPVPDGHRSRKSLLSGTMRPISIVSRIVATGLRNDDVRREPQRRRDSGEMRECCPDAHLHTIDSRRWFQPPSERTGLPEARDQ